MISTPKRVALITGTESTRIELLRQLEPLLKDYVEVVSFASDEGIPEKINTDLAVISSRLIMDEVRPFLYPGCPTILARRALNISNIDKLFSIPEGTKALLVNDTPETAHEVIGLLKEIGIDHIRFIPYFPGCRADSGAKLAVTPGETELVPSHIDTVINIGPRIIDLTTIVEILEKLALLDERANFVSAKYMETIVRLGKQLSQSINDSNRINDYLVKVLNGINDGILAFGKDGRITVFNQKSEALLKLRQAYVLGKNISQIIKDKEILNFLQKSHPNSDKLCKINDCEIMISKFPVEKMDSVVCTLKSTREMAEMEHKVRMGLIKKGFIGKYCFEDIVGSSRTITGTIHTAKKIAGTDLSILIHGESGTGKELFASAIHNESPRRSGPFLAVNFSALPEDLVESELFGYEEGAFTGAKKGGKVGLFEQAQNGTIFLDEIGDTSPKIQARLLRVLQEKELMRVGGAEIVPVNVRVIAATNKDLFRMCTEGKFREDLYYRLRRLYLKTPPLRERYEDLEGLVQHFLQKNNRQDLILSEAVRKVLLSHSWPGNVRELESAIEYMVAVADGDTVTLEHLPQDFFLAGRPPHDENHLMLEKLCAAGNPDEYLFILAAVQRCNKDRVPAGRKAISAGSRHLPFPMTEEQVRSRTDTLSQLGLLVKPKGRSGMHLTRKGAALLQTHGHLAFASF